MPSALADLKGPLVVAGHSCLDVIPRFREGGRMPGPAELEEVGEAALACGGAVPNVGLALRRLGAPVRLITGVGDDLWGREIRTLLAATGADVRLKVHPGKSSSYSLVLAPPGVDRRFIHDPAVNHLFDPDHDITDTDLRGALALHFGYPPAMRRTYADGGESLSRLMSRATAMGLITSLDLLWNDNREIDWHAWMGRVLPSVSLFCPSVDEVQLLLRTQSPPEKLADELLHLGAAVVILKRGDQGLLCQGTTDPARLARANLPPSWLGVRLEQPCLPATVVSTNGSGDCTIAGLLASVALGLPPARALKMACAVGACSVEAADATSGVKSWTDCLARAGLA